MRPATLAQRAIGYSWRKRPVLRLLLLLGACLPAGTALAQAAVADGATQVEEVLVTARKRVETVQDVPATIGVVSQTAIANTGAVSLLQLQSVAPGINLAKAPTGNEVGVTIRGLGSAPGVPSFDSSVSLFVDGVYAPRSRELAASMFDVDRIEVIRGTQAALLGKNTSLGAINLITRKPGAAFAADARGSYEFERGSTLLTGGADLPLGGTVRLRISGQTTSDEGWVKNVINDQYAPRTTDDAVRAVLVWEPTPDLEITGFIQHDFSRNFGSPVEQVASTGLPELLGAIAGYPGAVETRLDRRNAVTSPVLGGEQREKMRVDKSALTVNWQLGEHTLTSITAYSRYIDRNVADSDMAPGDYLLRGVDEKSHQFTQEVRLVSPADRTFSYIVGGLYLDGRLQNHTALTGNYPFGPLPGVRFAGAERTDFDQDDTATSIFAQGDYKLTEALRLTAGLRWTHEKKSVDLGRVVLTPGLLSLVVFPPYAPFSLEESEGNVDYSVGGQYEFNSNTRFYVSYGKGTKSGGFAQSVTRLETAPYDKEVAKTAEAGLKLQASNRTWVFNVAAFDTRVDGFQLVTFNGVQFVVGNTDLSSRGFEVEGYWYPVSGLRLYLNSTYADAKDRHTKEPIPLAPKWSGSAGFSYRGHVTDALDWKADGSVDFRSKRYYQQDPATSPPGEAFTPVNLGLALGSSDDSWEVRLIGRNLTDETESAFAFPTPLLPPGNQNAIAERGRTIALQISARR